MADSGGSLPHRRGEGLSEGVKDETLKKEVNMENWLKSLGLKGVKAKMKLPQQDSTGPSEPDLSQELRLEVTAVDSEEKSIYESGYETMTTYSDVASVVFASELKVQDWFSRQQGLEPRGIEEKAIKLLDAWKLEHVEPEAPKTVYAGNRFTVSESGAVGISCKEKPSLSVTYPNTDKPPLILSLEKKSTFMKIPKRRYSSVTFVKLSREEFLLANCLDDGNLYLWDIRTHTSKKVFDLIQHLEKPNKPNIFVINDRTIGCGEVHASSDGSRRVLILNTDTEEWSLSSMIRVNTEADVWDTCYMKTADGTSCLLLCCPHNHSMQAVEMVGGGIRWQTGKQQMGENFEPWSICTEDNTVYVTDFPQSKLHLLSPEDGSVIKSIDLHHYGITNPFAVRCYGEYLYIEYRIYGEKYTISKFAREIDQ